MEVPQETSLVKLDLLPYSYITYAAADKTNSCSVRLWLWFLNSKYLWKLNMEDTHSNSNSYSSHAFAFVARCFFSFLSPRWKLAVKGEEIAPVSFVVSTIADWRMCCRGRGGVKEGRWTCVWVPRCCCHGAPRIFHFHSAKKHLIIDHSIYHLLIVSEPFLCMDTAE